MNQPKPENADQNQVGRDKLIEDARNEQDEHPSQYRGQGLNMGDVEGHRDF